MRTDDSWPVEIRDADEFGWVMSILVGVNYTQKPDRSYAVVYNKGNHILEHLRDAFGGRDDLPRSFPTTVRVSSKVVASMSVWAQAMAAECSKGSDYFGAAQYEERAKYFNTVYQTRL